MFDLVLFVLKILFIGFVSIFILAFLLYLVVELLTHKPKQKNLRF